MFTTTNNDDGSFKVGTSANRAWSVGDKIRISGEGSKVRTVTFVMGKGDKTHLCFKGQGKVPMGQVTFELVDDVAQVA